MQKIAKTLTLAGICEHLGIARRTLYHMLKDGRFGVKPIAGTKPRRWRIEDIDAWRDARG